MSDKKGKQGGEKPDSTVSPEESAQLDAELESIASLLDGDFGEALGDLLGAPPPLPPPPEDQVMTSAPRPAGGAMKSAPVLRPPVLPPSAAPADSPTDDEIFGAEGSAEFDAAFAAARRNARKRKELPPDADAEPEARAPGDEAFSGAEKTRISDVDDDLLRQARPDTAPPKPPVRRGPAIVRRDRLTKPPVAEEQEESTRIAEPGFTMAQLDRERELEAEEEAAAAAPAAAVSVELDESFYDGIEIGAADEQAAEKKDAAPAPRRVTRNVVRRGDASRSTGSQSSVPVSVSSPAVSTSTPPDSAAPDELMRTGDFGRRPRTSGPLPAQTEASASSSGGTTAEHSPVSPMLAADIEAAVATDDAPGSNPLIDVLADFQRAEESSYREAPATDLSIDLEGGLDSWSAAMPDDDDGEVEIERVEAPAEDEDDDAGVDENVDVNANVNANVNEDVNEDEQQVRRLDTQVESDRFSVDISGEHDVTTLAAAPVVEEPPDDDVLLAIDLGKLALPEQDGEGEAEPDLILELAQLEGELEVALSEAVPDPVRLARLRLRAGLVAETLGDLDRAREHLEEACHADHRLLPAVRAMRRLLLRRGEQQEALRYLDHELELTSGDERRGLAAYRADLLLAVGEQDLARVAYGELVDAQPDDLRSLLAQMELAYSDDRDDELLDVLRGASAHVQDPELVSAMHLLGARLHEKAGRDEEAAGSLGAALAALPDDRLARWGLLRLALRAGHTADATRQGDELLGSTPDVALRAAMARRRALAALAQDEVEQATRALAPVADVADPLVLEVAADTHERAGRVPETIAALRGWAAVEPAAARRAEVLHRLAHLEEGEDAVRALAEAVEADPGDADAAAELAAARQAAGDVDAAVALEHTVAAEEPSAAAGAHVRAGRLFESVGRHDDAVAELRSAGLADPSSPIIIDALARALENAGRLNELLDLHRDTAEVAAAGPAATRERAARAGEALAARSGEGDAHRRVAAAEEGWQALRALEPGAWVAHAALERLAAARGDGAALADVLAAQQAAIRDPLRQSMIAARRAAVLASLGDAGLDDARGVLQEAAAEDPADPRAADRLALAAGSAGRWTEAAEALAARADALPDGAEKDALRYRAAAILDGEGEASRAASLLGPTLAGQPGFTGAAVLQERLYRRLGDTEGLSALLEREARAEEGPPATRAARLIRLAETIADGSGDSARAAALYREALALRGDDTLVRDGFRRIAIAAHEVSPLADLALADLKRAEEQGDVAAKVSAYEELARIDGDLRGDVASATMAWEAAVALDSGHMTGLRALERTYLGVGETSGERRTAELGVVYDKLATALEDSSPADAVPILLERARLLERQGQAVPALADHRRALSLGWPRMSLFKLEMRAREAGALEEMAAYDVAVADYFSGDARAQAAFLTRAGEALADAGKPEDAIAKFQAAADVWPGFAPALRAWRRVALAGERWGDVVTACEREAQVVRADEERVALLHLAGVTAMDRAGDLERAGRCLRHVLVLDPRHQDAFKRLRKLFAGPDHKAELAELLSARVEIETHPGRLIDLHQTLALLYRESLADPEKAKAHLRAVMTRDPRNLAAVTALSEVAWGQGNWGEAAEALILRAKLEKSPETLKEIFFRLGVIYAEKLPDRKWAVKSFERVLQQDPNDVRALEHLSALSVEAGEWRVALGATERLVGLDSDPATRVKHLLRVSHIHEEGNRDRKRAEEALRRALEADPASTDALAALIGFYARVRDTASLRVNLDRVSASMRYRLEKDAFDGVPYRLLARALEARAEAGVAGSLEAARNAAELAEALGVADEADAELAAQVKSHMPGIKGLGLLHIDELLFHHAIPNGFRQLFRLLYDTLGKRYPPDLRRAGVSKADRLPKTGHPVREVLARVAAEIGLGDFEIYLTGSRPNVFAVELTDPISIILGTGVAQSGEQQLRFAGARAMKLATSYMAVPASLGPEELGVLLAAVIRQYDAGFTPAGVNMPAVGEETQRLARLIPKRLRDEIVRFATEISGHALDHHALWLGVQHTGNRAGLIAAGSVRASLDVLLRAGGHRDLRSARGDAQVEELMRFSVSNEHCEVRAALAV